MSGHAKTHLGDAVLDLAQHSEIRLHEACAQDPADIWGNSARFLGDALPNEVINHRSGERC